MRKYRHEIKYMISLTEAEILKQYLNKIMTLDTFAYNQDGSYEIKSLYFDDAFSTAFYEKIDGVLYRKKYRIRIYNNSKERIKLECKYKHNNMTSKDSCLISLDTYSKIIDGNIQDIQEKQPLLVKFIDEMKFKLLKPSVIVKYNRLAYTYPVSDVRVTFDSLISNEGFNFNLFNKNSPTFKPIKPNMIVLEVKYNDILPRMIADIISMTSINKEAVSKFQRCKSIQ